MVPPPDNPTAHNAELYDQLISLIENSQGRLAPIIVSCEDNALRQRIILRYESEARQAQIRPYRIVLGQEPSLRAGLQTLKQHPARSQCAQTGNPVSLIGTGLRSTYRSGHCPKSGTGADDRRLPASHQPLPLPD